MRFNNIFSEERLVVGENGLKNILVQPSAKDETKWNVKSEESLKLLILFLSCFFDKTHEIILYWYTTYNIYVLQHLAGLLNEGEAYRIEITIGDTVLYGDFTY